MLICDTEMNQSIYQTLCMGEGKTDEFASGMHTRSSLHYLGPFMRGSRNNFQRGSNFFLLNESIQITLKSGHYGPASEATFKWYLAGVAMMAQH